MKFVSCRLAAYAAMAGVLAGANMGSFAQSRAQQESTKTLAFRPDLSGPSPLAPSRGSIRAYQISSPDEFVPGQLADGYLGDYVLQNDAIRVIIARPDKKGVGGISGGSILDVSREARPLDYINSIKTVPDLATTDSAVLYNYVDDPAVESATTGTIVMHGTASVGSSQDADPVVVDVVTTFSLPKNSNVMQIDTAYTNPGSTQTAALLPGDAADWGEAATFVEGLGLASNNLTTASFVLGFASDYSVGIVTSGSKMLSGLYTNRDSVIPAYEPVNSTTQSLSRVPTQPKRMPGQSADEVSRDYRDPLNPLALIEERIRKGELKPLTETEYRTMTTSTLNSLAGLTSGTEAIVAEDAPVTASIKLTLPPGQTFQFTRYLVVSDGDFSRIANFAYSTKGIATGDLLGAVLEAGTDKPIPDADIYISGGPKWNGTVTAPAYYKTRTRGDGTFACRVPAGKYVVIPGKPGRRSISEYTIQEIQPGRQPKVVVLTLTPESVVRVAVSQAETRTSTPLPCKITFVEKQGTARMDWGDGPRGDRGVRNTWYMPYGWANIPLTPGRYVAYISRGPEYEVVRQDISLAPGGQQIIKVSLPHTMRDSLKGMFGVDAGLMTSASACGAAPIEDRVMQAVCEGVHVIVSGDYNRATDFQPVIKQLGLEKWIKAMRGIRLLLNKGEESAEILAYPLTPEQANKLTDFLPQIQNVPPDLALADLRKAFPGILLEITRPTDVERGYFTRYPFDDITKKFGDRENLPPPDYDSFQIYEGKKLGLEQVNYPRYSDLQVVRSNDTTARVAPLSPLAYSNSSLPFAQEIGYPRVYLHTRKAKLDEISEEDVVGQIRGQHYTVTNGLFVGMELENLANGRYDKRPGDVIDLSTTRILRLQMKVLASPWVSFGGWVIHENGLVQVSTPSVTPTQDLVRFPIMGVDVTTRYIDEDSILDGAAYGVSRSLAPVVSDALPDFGGPVQPYAFTAPVFVDKDQDGKITLKAPDLVKQKDAPPPRPDPTITE